MDDFRQSAAPTARRRSASGRRLLGLLVVLALVALLPAHALADGGVDALWQGVDVGPALAHDATSEADAPPETAPPVAEATPDEPEPAPSDPDPEPAPSEPAPAPSEPAPSEPEPAPSEPAPSDPAPAPSDPAPPVEEVPAEPDPSESAPSDSAPSDDRAPVAKPPSEERQLPADDEAMPALATPLAPTTLEAPATAEVESATDSEQSAVDDDARRDAKIVRRAFERLGLGTIAGPGAADAADHHVAAPAQACTPIGTVAATGAPQVGTVVAPHPTTRTHRVDDDPPLVRGPPAPLDSPSSPMATAAGGSAATGGVSGERDCAILADQLVLTLAGGESKVADDCRDHEASAPAEATARAPPVA